MDNPGILHINLTVKINTYFYDVFFLTIKWVQKGVYRNGDFFYCEINMKYARVIHFILLRIMLL